jgi:hypothetical protein
VHFSLRAGWVNWIQHCNPHVISTAPGPAESLATRRATYARGCPRFASHGSHKPVPYRHPQCPDLSGQFGRMMHVISTRGTLSLFWPTRFPGCLAKINELGIPPISIADRSALGSCPRPPSLRAKLALKPRRLPAIGADNKASAHPVGFQNSAASLDLGIYAARWYSLRRPPRTGRRLGEIGDRMVGPGRGGGRDHGGVGARCSGPRTRPSRHAGGVRRRSASGL